jgi:hypothetical protein
MSMSRIHRRLDALAARIRPKSVRSFTLEELCRSYWEQDKAGFRLMVTTEGGFFRVSWRCSSGKRPSAT